MLDRAAATAAFIDEKADMEHMQTAEIVDFVERRANRFFPDVDVRTAILYAYPGCPLPPPGKFAIQSGQMRFNLECRLNRAHQGIVALENLYFPVDKYVERLQDAEQLFAACEQHCPQPLEEERGHILWGYHWITIEEGRKLDALTDLLRDLGDEVEDAIKWVGLIHEHAQLIDQLREYAPSARRLYVRRADLSNPNIEKLIAFMKSPDSYLQNLEELLDRAYAGIESSAIAQAREDIRSVGEVVAQLKTAMEQLPRMFSLECLDGAKI
jgi:hypothetical protein